MLHSRAAQMALPLTIVGTVIFVLILQRREALVSTLVGSVWGHCAPICTWYLLNFSFLEIRGYYLFKPATCCARAFSNLGTQTFST